MTKGKGWHGNPYGHSLASRGIKMQSRQIEFLSERKKKNNVVDDPLPKLKTIIRYLDEPENSSALSTLEHKKRKLEFFYQGVERAYEREKSDTDQNPVSVRRVADEREMQQKIRERLNSAKLSTKKKITNFADEVKDVTNPNTLEPKELKTFKAIEGFKNLGEVAYWIVDNNFSSDNNDTSRKLARAFGRLILDPNYLNRFPDSYEEKDENGNIRNINIDREEHTFILAVKNKMKEFKLTKDTNLTLDKEQIKVRDWRKSR